MILLLLISAILSISLEISGCTNSVRIRSTTINFNVKTGRKTDYNVQECIDRNMGPYSFDDDGNILGWDCLKTFLYHSEDDFCYDSYRQGPCPPEHYYVLSPGENVAKCEKNPCRIDGLVPYQGKCYFLWNSGPACNKSFVNLGINASFQIECGVFEYFGDRENLKRSKSCPEGAYLNPMDKNHTKYVCDCEPTFIFSATNNTCHQAYRQGFCAPGDYVVLPPGEKEPKCEKNPCEKDGLVPFKGGCHEIYKSGASCGSSRYELSVSEKDYKIECALIFDNHRRKGIINAPTKACPPGSRRVLTSCKQVFS